MILTTTLPKAWTAFTKNKKYLIPIILLEFIFLFTIVYIHVVFFTPTSQSVTQAQDIMAEEVQKIPEAELWQLESILVENQEFMTNYHQFLAGFAFFLISCLAAWMVFRTPIWYFSHKTILKKMPFGTHALKFCLLSAFWFIIILAAFIIYGITTSSASLIVPLVSSQTNVIIMWLALIVIAYFAQISFALIPAQQTFKNTFVYGIKHAKTLIQAYLVNILLTFIALTLPFNFIETKPLIALAAILIITIPALAFARLHMITATWYRKSSRFSEQRRTKFDER